MRIGERIAEARNAAGLTQGELGRLAGLARQSISYIESRGNLPLQGTLEKIAQALGLSVPQLLGEEPLPFEQERELAALTHCYLHLSRSDQILIRELCQRLTLIPREAL